MSCYNLCVNLKSRAVHKFFIQGINIYVSDKSSYS